jgi:predicted nucleotidyltransferase
MPVNPSDDAALSRFRSALAQAYGPRLERIILFGSRARGENTPESDYDIAVFLRGMNDRAEELDRLADLSTDILYDIGRLIHALPFAAGAYRDRTPLMHEIRKDGVDL